MGSLRFGYDTPGKPISRRPSFVTGTAFLPVLLLAWILAMSVLCPGLAQTATEADFERANKLYEQGKFAEAAASYGKILHNGRASAALYFNLGNALFKSGEIGRAILNYRRAEQLAPRDPDVRANLQFARNTVGGESGPQPIRWRRWINRLTLDEWTIMAGAALWLWFGLLTLEQLRPGLGKGLRGYTATTGVAVGLLGACLALAFYDRFRTQWAIVVIPEAVVRYGPLEESQSHYTLRNGAELRITDRQNDWIEVVDSNGRRGWLRRDQVVSLEGTGNQHS